MTIPENTSRLRRDIDSGKTGDKVDFPDPAAAPLGTDAEAGDDTSRSASAPVETTAPPPPPKNGVRREQLGVLVYSLGAGVVTVAILAIVVWTG